MAGFNYPLATAEAPHSGPADKRITSWLSRCKQLRLGFQLSLLAESYGSQNAALQATLQAYFESKLEEKFVHREDTQ